MRAHHARVRARMRASMLLSSTDGVRRVKRNITITFQKNITITFSFRIAQNHLSLHGNDRPPHRIVN